MNRINKKGISAVVATVLIILITVAAVAIIWAAIIPMIKENTVGTTMCLDAISQLSVESEGGYTCWQAPVGVCSDSTKLTQVACVAPATWSTTPGQVKIQAGMGAADFELAGVQVIVSEAGSTSSFEGTEVTGTLPSANENKILTVSYTNTTVNGPDKVEVAPIVAVGNVQKTCDVAGSTALKPCA